MRCCRDDCEDRASGREALFPRSLQSLLKALDRLRRSPDDHGGNRLHNVRNGSFRELRPCPDVTPFPFDTTRRCDGLLTWVATVCSAVKSVRVLRLSNGRDWRKCVSLTVRDVLVLVPVRYRNCCFATACFESPWLII